MNNPLPTLFQSHFNWTSWEALIRSNGYTVDRPYRSVHPSYPEIVYPINYGYINNTIGSDGEEVDLFIGTGTNKLVAAILTTDFRKGDREWKGLYNCTPKKFTSSTASLTTPPIYLVNVDFIMRYDLKTRWYFKDSS